MPNFIGTTSISYNVDFCFSVIFRQFRHSEYNFLYSFFLFSNNKKQKLTF